MPEQISETEVKRPAIQLDKFLPNLGDSSRQVANVELNPTLKADLDNLFSILFPSEHTKLAQLQKDLIKSGFDFALIANQFSQLTGIPQEYFQVNVNSSLYEIYMGRPLYTLTVLTEDLRGYAIESTQDSMLWAAECYLDDVAAVLHGSDRQSFCGAISEDFKLSRYKTVSICGVEVKLQASEALPKYDTIS